MKEDEIGHTVIPRLSPRGLICIPPQITWGLIRGGGLFHQAEFWRGSFKNNKSNLGKSSKNVTIFP